MDDPPIKRKLTAILAADAVGYSRMMSQNEEGTLRVLAGHRKLIDDLIMTRDGRIVGTAGDSVLAEFPSSVEAVRCAVEIQEALKTRNDSLPDSDRLLFRIGVNLGDVMISGDDILGDGVNVASRLESICEPGGVCVSSSIYDQITGKLNLGFIDLGQQSLKNITRPVHAYRLAGAVAAAPPLSPPPSAPARPERPERRPQLLSRTPTISQHAPSRLPWMLAGGGIALLLIVALLFSWIYWSDMADQQQAVTPPYPTSYPSEDATLAAQERAIEAQTAANLARIQQEAAQAAYDAETSGN